MSIKQAQLLIFKKIFTFTDHCSGPGGAISPLCASACPDNNFFDLHQIFTTCTNMGGNDQSGRLFVIAQETLLWQPILAYICENWHIPSSFCALAFRNGWENRNMDARDNTADDPFTSRKNSVNSGPVNAEFCRRVCAGRATRWVLPTVVFTTRF